MMNAAMCSLVLALALIVNPWRPFVDNSCHVSDENICAAGRTRITRRIYCVRHRCPALPVHAVIVRHYCRHFSFPLSAFADGTPNIPGNRVLDASRTIRNRCSLDSGFLSSWKLSYAQYFRPFVRIVAHLAVDLDLLNKCWNSSFFALLHQVNDPRPRHGTSPWSRFSAYNDLT